MKKSIIYALDFDGVICDSAVETGIAGWKCAATIWPDMTAAIPPQKLIDQFRQIRPYLETGYEAILIMRLLFQGKALQALKDGYTEKLQQALSDSGHDVTSLKQLFGKTRDAWIATSPQEWIAMNPLFSGIQEKLINLSTENTWYIVTTKQERFVEQILNANSIRLPKENIYGLDRKLSKEAVLTELQLKHPEASLYFVEDRLAALINVHNNTALRNVQLLFAQWGYNTEADKATASKLPLQTITLQNFLSAM